MVVYTCPKCKAVIDILPLNNNADYILDKYNDIDTITGRSIELLCACKTPLLPIDDLIIETHTDTYLQQLPYED